MLTKDDLKAIGALLDEKLANYPTKADLNEKLREQKIELLMDMSKLSKELLDKMEGHKNELLGEMRKQKKEIVNDMGDFLHKNLLPVLDNYEKRIDRLEKAAGLPPPPSSH